ncbi:Toll-like receptor 1 [Nibea albiflora]|uniref:Toll-like receptor 1 n=1 Tax=Nibea albiflora TaxID=240163 RepID=A0ACB7FIB9_NIBAL|nr:Toll-like receptor 1 [Nibea albiflora]
MQPLTAVNVEGLNKFDSGQFSEMEVPDQLRLIIEDHEKYRQAVRIINSVSQNKVYSPLVRALMLMSISIILGFTVSLASFLLGTLLGSSKNENRKFWPLFISCLYSVSLGMLIQIGLWKRDEVKYKVREMQKAVGQANAILSEEKVLMGCRSNSQIYLVFFKDNGANELQTADTLSAVQPSPSVYVPPTLRDGECYHVFISYSSTDYQWTHSLIDRLESRGLQVCYHERDFTPGRTVLENMSECIQQSQKVLLVLSPEFVRSRWCLLEANMSLFRDCLANDPDFNNKLLKVLCTSNQQLQGSTVVPFQPPSIYNGKAMQPLTAVNVEVLCNWDSGQFSEMEVPDQLRLIIEDHEKALLFFSSGYACCLSKRHFPFPQPSSTSHLEGGVCFCQYVSQQLNTGQWE